MLPPACNTCTIIPLVKDFEIGITSSGVEGIGSALGGGGTVEWCVPVVHDQLYMIISGVDIYSRGEGGV